MDSLSSAADRQDRANTIWDGRYGAGGHSKPVIEADPADGTQRKLLGRA